MRLLARWDIERIDAAVARAANAGIDGAIVVCGDSYPSLAEGEVVSSATLPRALEVVARVAGAMPTALSGGVVTPADAEQALDAGARAIALSDGLVAAGPGLPQRINTRLAERSNPTPAARAPRVGPAPTTRAPALARGASGRVAIGRALLMTAAAALLSLGAGYLVLAVTVQLLPHDVAHLGMPASELCERAECRIVDFIGHDRAILGGTLLANAVMVTWLVIGPLRRGEDWAWWALLGALVVDLAGFMTFLSYGYAESWHAAATLLLGVLWAAGLALTRTSVRPDGALRALRHAGAAAWTWSPAGRGRLYVILIGAAFTAAGAGVAAVASTGVFVAQDLDYLRLDASGLERISDRLIPVIARDRAEFGVSMASLGLLFAAGAWKGIRPGARGAWRALTAAGALHFTAATAAHVAIGYTSFVHLAPVYAAAAALAVAAVTLRSAVYDTPSSNASFPDV